ncbi:PREDICTED: zinc finger [Prunus dulcis]|uniref:PREDICTED: zinc finger n=1 Tax=Prunus dulcis TaxID=3755 RepID=A0A5E4G9W1_PRUDU|nr:PREDICTED: zinc finger [Prunus dulcis]
MPLLIVKLVRHPHPYPHPHQHLYPLYRSLNIKMKFKKYWGDFDKLNQILMVVLVLDPRYKLGNLEFILKSWFENPEDTVKKKNEIKEILKKLHEEYAMLPLPLPPPPSTQSSSFCSSDTTSMNTTSSSLSRVGKKRRQMNENWRKETRANDVVILEHEIDRYITDPIKDVVHEFDVLKW